MTIDTISIGSKHFINEDRYVVKNLEALGVTAVLADGMGGLSLGDKAAEVVTNSLADFITKNYDGTCEKNILQKGLEYADMTLKDVSIKNRSKMGAAIAVVIMKERQLYCTWQGNVRVFVLHQHNIELITEDHIADIGYGRTALTRCVKGAGLREDIPFVSRDLVNGDMVVLCTDGLYNIIEPELLNTSIDRINSRIGMPEDDASMIRITV
jgi:serine/threonine protein phosphatase PrpC